jgi:hypothetical protein
MRVNKWGSRTRERLHERLFERFKQPERDETEARLRTLEVLREWGAIDEEEFEEHRQALVATKARAGPVPKKHTKAGPR